MDWTILWWLLAGITVLAGLAGTILPAIPGVPIIFAGLFLGAWIQRFEVVGWGTLSVLAALAVFAWLVDFVAGTMGARYLGASSRSLWGATIGAIAGIFFGLPGIILGPFVGAVAGELSGGSDLLQSGRSGVGAWLGMVFATAAKLAIAFLMISLFLIKLGLGPAINSGLTG